MLIFVPMIHTRELKKVDFMNKIFPIALITLLGIIGNSCIRNKSNYRISGVDNPSYLANTEFQLFEDLTSPKFGHLIKKYRLDTVVRGESDEFKRMLLLRHWIKSVIRIEDHSDHYSGDGYAEGILDAALKGEGFHCAHFMRVQNAVMNAFGYVTRVIGAGPGVKGGPDGNHGIDEIWSNKYCKWFLSDAKYNHHFEKNGIPLSALEVRDEYIKNKAADIVLVKGKDRIPIEFDSEFEFSKKRFAQTYTWIKWYIYGNRHTIYPNKYNGSIMVYEDDFFKNNIYYRDGKPVPKEAFDSWRHIKDRKVFEWTPNVLNVVAKVNGQTLNVHISSETPNFKEYQMKENINGQWRKIDNNLSLELSKEGHAYFFRSVNLANVAGPEYKVVVIK